MCARILEGRNRATADEMASFVDKYEELEKEKLREKMAYMGRCRRITEQQSELLADAKSQGAPKAVIKAVAKAREYERKAEALMEALEDDGAQLFKDIREALGDYADLPLGAAAVARETSDDERTAAVVAAVKADLTDEEAEAWDRAAPDAAIPY